MKSEQDINQQITELAKKKQRYIQFNEWLSQYGVKTAGIDFPAAFGSIGIIGIAAQEDLPVNKVIMFIPNDLLISTQLVEFHPQLGKIVKNNQQFFDAKQNEDGHFNLLAMFVMFEKIKGEHSQWYQYLNMPQNSTTMLSWSKQDVQFIEDNYITKLHMQFKVDECWKSFKQIVQKYPEMFPVGQFDKQLFFKSYEFVMTRCYGLNQTGTYLIPGADALNHDIDAMSELWFNQSFEFNQQIQPKNYQIQHQFLDCSVVPNVKLDYSEEDVSQIQCYITEKMEYIRKYQDLVELDKTKIILELLQQEEINNLVLLVNKKRLEFDPSADILDIPFFMTSDEEDNDSGDENSEQEQSENDFIKKKEITMTRLQEKLRCMEVSKGSCENERAADVQENQSVAQTQNQTSNFGNRAYYYHQRNWDWFDYFDQNNNYIVATQKPYKKGSQIFTNYGRRTNRFLLVWYGFCTFGNIYDSFPFRLWTHIPFTNLTDSNIQDLVYTDYVDYDEREDGVIFRDGIKLPFENLTKEFRIKESRICEQLITYVRIYKLMAYEGQNAVEIMVTLPSDLNYEIEVFELCLKILNTAYKQSCPTPIERDEDILKDTQINSKERFAAIFRFTKKKIILQQIKLFSILIQIMRLVIKGKDQYKEIFQNRFIEFGEEDDYVFMRNRQKMQQYLQGFELGILKKSKGSTNN